MTMTSAFLEAWKQHLTKENKLEYINKKLPNRYVYCENSEYDIYMELGCDFSRYYISTVSEESKDQLILEFGFKKLIDLMCYYNGEEICDELLNFKEYKEEWIEMLLCNLLNIFTY